MNSQAKKKNLISANVIVWKLPEAAALLWFPCSKNLHGWDLDCSKNALDTLLNFHKAGVFPADATSELSVVAILVS